jgi:hypothetical protein
LFKGICRVCIVAVITPSCPLAAVVPIAARAAAVMLAAVDVGLAVAVAAGSVVCCLRGRLSGCLAPAAMKCRHSRSCSRYQDPVTAQHNAGGRRAAFGLVWARSYGDGRMQQKERPAQQIVQPNVGIQAQQRGQQCSAVQHSTAEQGAGGLCAKSGHDECGIERWLGRGTEQHTRPF